MSQERRMPNVGDTLKGQYLLQSVLGVGGFGKAFSGIDTAENTQIAVKVLTFSSSDNILQFSLEAFRMARFDHPRLIKIIDYDAEEKTLPFIVMPLASNGSLGQEIKTRRGQGELVPIERSLTALEQTAEALQYLHDRRVVHQDVKPDNILLPNDRDFWLSDLGIARILKPNDSLQVRSMGFSPQYASPEQASGRGEPASDQYALGITAYFLLTGRLPFLGEMAALLYQHREKTPLTLVEAVESLKRGERIPDILRALDPIVMRAIAKKPDERYDEVTTFTRTLRKTADDAAQANQLGKPFPGVSLPRQKEGFKAEQTPFEIRAQELVRLCSDLFDQEKYAELQQASDLAIALDPNNADAWLYKGLSLCRIGKWEETLPVYDRVIELDPTMGVAFRNKADSLNRLGRYEEALQSLEQALKLKPTSLDALGDKGFALNALGRHEEALAASDQAIKVNPEFDYAYFNKGFALSALGRREEALATYDQAINLNPEKSVVFYEKGNTLYALGRREEAIVAYDQAIKLDPNSSDAFYSKGVTLGRREDAIAAYDQVNRIDPTNSNAFYRKGIALRALGRREEALAAFNKVLELDPSSSQTRRIVKSLKKSIEGNP